MKAATKADMLNALRLTRGGRLKEAMAALRGGGLPPPQAAPAAAPALMESLLTISNALPNALQDVMHRAGHIAGLEDAAPAVPQGASFETRGFTNAAGSRDYRLYIPSNHRGEPLPLVIMLHGCTQSPEDFATGTRINELAEQKRFLVAYPGQNRTANITKCWNWFKPEDQSRGSGEASIIAGITEQIIAEFGARKHRVYAAGISAGGAMAANLAAAYPELYAGIGIHSGLAAKAAHDIGSAMAAMHGGGGAAAASNATLVPTIVFQGDADHTVNPANSRRIIAPFGSPLATSEGTAPSGIKYRRTTYAQAELWMVHGLGHAWSGGNSAGSFTDPRGPDASAEMIRFFKL